MVGFGKGLGCGCCDGGFDCPTVNRVTVFETDAFAPHPTVYLTDAGTVSGGSFFPNDVGSARTYAPATGVPSGRNFAYPKIPDSFSGRIEFRVQVPAVNELSPGQQWGVEGKYLFRSFTNAPSFGRSFEVRILRTNYVTNADSFEVGGLVLVRQYGVGFGPDYDDTVFFQWDYQGGSWLVTFGDSQGINSGIVSRTGQTAYVCGREMIWSGRRFPGTPTSKIVQMSDVVYTET